MGTKYTKKDFLKAALLAEVNMIEARLTCTYLKEVAKQKKRKRQVKRPLS